MIKETKKCLDYTKRCEDILNNPWLWQRGIRVRFSDCIIPVTVQYSWIQRLLNRCLRRSYVVVTHKMIKCPYMEGEEQRKREKIRKEKQKQKEAKTKRRSEKRQARKKQSLRRKRND